MTDLGPNLLAAIIYAALGIAIFTGTFVIFDKLTPGSMWKEIIDEHNTALAVLMGAVSIGIAIVIAAAIW
jgi:uncharacterized membrane protein YjfL (UPF0719 family)